VPFRQPTDIRLDALSLGSLCRLFQVECRAQGDVDFHELFRAESAGAVTSTLAPFAGRFGFRWPG
jgi:hypothetical protein